MENSVGPDQIVYSDAITNKQIQQRLYIPLPNYVVVFLPMRLAISAVYVYMNLFQ